MKKNIALLLPCVSGGGAERVASLLSQYLSNQGYQVHFFVDDFNQKQSYQIQGQVHRIIYYDRLANLGHIGKLREFARIVHKSAVVKAMKKKYKIDISISFMEEFNYLNVLSKGKDKVILRICTILSERTDCLNSVLYNKRLIKWFYNRANQIVVMTEYAKQDMIRNYAIRKKLLCRIENPVQFTRKDNILEPIEWTYGNHIVIAVSRLDDVKQLWHLIRGFTEVARRDRSAQLLLLGQGINRKYLGELVKAYHLEERVIFLGFQRDVDYYLQRSKVFVLTSKTEGFPNSMIEALHIGIPVISVDCPGAPREILAPHTQYTGKLQNIEYATYGILIPRLRDKKCQATEPLNKGEKIMAEAILTVLNDEKVYHQYKNVGLEKCKNYELQIIGKQWEQLFGR